MKLLFLSAVTLVVAAAGRADNAAASDQQAAGCTLEECTTTQQQRRSLQDDTTSTVDNGGVIYADCLTQNEYYAPLLAKGAPESWTLADIRAHLTATHRTVVPSFPTKENPRDITEALIDLWPGSEEESVYLIYRDESMDAKPANLLETWKKEAFWPAERGAEVEAAITTDVHQTAPGDWSVLDDKKILNPVRHVFYGECGTVNFIDQCVSPANSESAPDTAHDTKIYLPPEVSRGDIARALFYDAVRYGNELDLELVDCAPFGPTQFGYRSTLLEWHAADQPSPTEQLRNVQGCANWQGNRNIFVDYPQLVTQFFGTPDTIPVGMRTFSGCLTPTQNPTATPNDCSAIIPGGISMYVFNSADADQLVLSPIDNIPATVESIFVSDNAWDGNFLLDTEGTVEFKIPADGIQAGVQFGFEVLERNDDGTVNKTGRLQLPGQPVPDEDDDVGEWQIVPNSANFNLDAQNGDNIFIYCINADDQPHFINALTFNGAWKPTGLEVYQENETALPERLEDLGSVALAGYKNWLYNGTQGVSRDILVPSFSDASNWEGSDSRYQISAATMTAAGGRMWLMISTSLVMVVVALSSSSLLLF